MSRLLAIVIAAGVAVALALDVRSGSATVDRYPYANAAFDTFVADSYRETDAGGVEPFARWLETAYAQTPGAHLGARGSLREALRARRAELTRHRDARARAARELATGAWLHRMVKTLIPRFSLDRGFEFTNTVSRGERQCLLQSVLIAALLQAMDVDAGVAMVWRNERAQVSNNGHAVALIRLADGRHVLVDASDREPFMRHQGLFMLTPHGYRFVTAGYAADGTIASYRTAGGAGLARAEVRPLDAAFLRSQFYYYRGERAPGGFLLGPRTAAGLAASARHLEEAVRLAPGNPLPVYVLGHVYLRQGRTDAARAQYVRGYELYRRYGHVPAGPRAAYAAASR